ncbi:MAG: tRNA pseudouridine(38-40) synthase TruA [Victivallales bacterium]|nr:tRNA pseudouridine(38-40) synthase TruA [Victivallales bacterium]MCF7888958.1 tRNA pseudouridine(38-40) synthase TruA [Victivallales bacterium]
MITRYNCFSPKYVLEIAFDGTGYHGWQYQPDRISVQQVIEEKLTLLYKKKVGLVGAGRTDSGVHALGMTAAFALPPTPIIPIGNLQKALNSILPADIFIRSIFQYNNEFHPRFDAFGKAYTYIVTSKETGPFLHKWHWKFPFSYEVEKLEQCCKYLTGKHNFKSFAVALNKSEKNPLREIYKIDINCFGDYTCITFLGKSFLYKMVRSLVGSMLHCSRAKADPRKVKEILDAEDRAAGYKTAPPNGLFLMKVFYRKEEIDKFKLTALPFMHKIK